MEAINSRHTNTCQAMRGCDAGVLCGSLAPIAYVPVQLYRLPVCSNCQTKHIKCQEQNEVLDPKNISNEEKSCRSTSPSRGKNSTADEPCDRERGNSDAIRCQCQRTSEGSEFGASIFTTLGICEGHFIELKGRRNVMLCPKILSPFYGHGETLECAGKCKDHHKPDGHEEQGTSQQDDQTNEMNFKYGGLDGSTNSQAHRRLSSDSGRITWSDSGDSVFSDVQGVESSQSAKGANCRKADLPTLLSQSNLAAPSQLKISKSLSSKLDDMTLSPQEHTVRSVSPAFDRRRSATPTVAAGVLEERSAASDSTNDDDVRDSSGKSGWQPSPPPPTAPMPRRHASCAESVPFLGEDEEEHYLTDLRRRRRLKRTMRTLQEPRRRQRIQSSSPEPRRSSSDWTIRRTGRMTHTGTTLGCLEEDDATCISEDNNKQRRPRSRSLFLGANRNETRLFSIGRTSPTRKTSPRSQKPLDINFCGQTHLIDAWEIGGAAPGKESIKCYGLTAVPYLGGFAMTDSDKVKIKAYGLNGELKVAFGTPTWPRYGRGIILTSDGKHIAVCHLSEVCIYTLDGVCKDQIAHDEFTSCWGIALNSHGNYIITDPKSSSLFLMNQNGELVGRIGGDDREVRRQSKTRSSVGWRKSKSDKALSGKKTKSILQAANRNRRSSNPCTPQIKSVSQTGNATSNDKRTARLLTPRYVSVNSKNQIVVTDTRQRCVMVLEEDGSLVYTIGGGRMGCEECCARENAIQERNRNIIRRMASHSESEIWGAGSKTGGITRSETADIPIMMEQDERRNQFHSPGSRSSTSINDLRDARCSFSPSRSIGNRLSDHVKCNTGQLCSSLEEVSAHNRPEKGLERSKSKLREIVKRFRKPGWLNRKNRNKSSNCPSFQIAKRESLTSLSVFNDSSEPVMRLGHSQLFDEISLSASPTSPQPDKKTIFMFPCVEDKVEHSSRHDSGFSAGSSDFQSAELLDNDATGYELSRDVTGELDSADHDRRACRSCHVEDPRGICIDKYDNIIMVDRARHRISVFNSSGHFIRHLLTEQDGLNAPMSICILYDGCIAVTDSSSSIKIFRFLQ